MRSFSSRGAGAWLPRGIPQVLDPKVGIELVSPALAGGFFTTEPPGKPQFSVTDVIPCLALCCLALMLPFTFTFIEILVFNSLSIPFFKKLCQHSYTYVFLIVRLGNETVSFNSHLLKGT